MRHVLAGISAVRCLLTPSRRLKPNQALSTSVDNGSDSVVEGVDAVKPINQLTAYHPPQSIASVEKKMRRDANDISQPRPEDLEDFPQAPEVWMCCGSGCQNCVWIEYTAAVADYIDHNHRMDSMTHEQRAEMLRSIVEANVSDVSLRSYILMELHVKKLV